MNRHRRLSRIGTFPSWLRPLASIDSLGAQVAVTHHPRSCSASAGRDSLRSVGHAANAATLLNWKHAWRFEDTCFDERCSLYAASCSCLVRLASLPSRPSSARRPCLAISLHSALTCEKVPSDSTRNTSNRTGFQTSNFSLPTSPDASC